MVFIEVLISYSKLLVCFVAIGVALFYLVFRLMSGGMFYYYIRSSAFGGADKALLHAERMSKKFEPIVKRVVSIPLGERLLVQGVIAGNKKFKRLEQGPIDNEILFKQ
jgi:hypothetical protein